MSGLPSLDRSFFAHIPTQHFSPETLTVRRKGKKGGVVHEARHEAVALKRMAWKE